MTPIELLDAVMDAVMVRVKALRASGARSVSVKTLDFEISVSFAEPRDRLAAVGFGMDRGEAP